MNFQFTLSEKEVNTILAGLQELRFREAAPVIDVLKAQIQANYEEAAKPVASTEENVENKEEMVHKMDHMFNGEKEGDNE